MTRAKRSLITLTATISLLGISSATLAPDMSGVLGAGGYDEYTWTIAKGDWEISGFADDGDLDILVYDMKGNLVASDTDGDNVPIVNIRANTRTQCKIRFKNASRSRSLDYVGYLDSQ